MIPLLKLTPYIGGTVAPSPNHDARKASAIEGIVLHATVDEGDESRSLSWMLSPRSEVSSHLLVNRAGAVTRLVGDRQRAWHAGLSSWRGTTDVNSITLGIEIANRSDGEAYTDAQYSRIAEIVAHYCRQGLSVNDVVSHAEIAPGRRTDPVGWDWKRFRTMVQEQLQPVSVDAACLAYDRRSAERVAAQETAKHRGSTANPVKPAVCTCNRTLWLNALTLLAAAGVIVAETLDLAYWIGFTLPEQVTMWVLFGIGMVNIILRYQNKCPVREEQKLARSVPETAMRVAGRAQAFGKGGAAAGLPRRIR